MENEPADAIPTAPQSSMNASSTNNSRPRPIKYVFAIIGIAAILGIVFLFTIASTFPKSVNATSTISKTITPTSSVATTTIFPPEAICVAGSGYLCTGLNFTHGTGNLQVTIGQNIGTNWVSSEILFVPQGSSMGTHGPIVSAGDAVALGELASGQTASVTWRGVVSNPAKGATIAGTIWACYSTSAGTIAYNSTTGNCTVSKGAAYYTQMATLTATAT